MGNWTLVNSLGSGKTLLGVWRAQLQLEQDLKLAGNVDIYLEYLMPWYSKATYVRLTDFPSTEELVALGKGSDSKKEKTFGLLFLDELAMFLNARSWQKTGREDFIIFLRHLRKRHWHSLLLAQDVDSLDKQVRNALIERVVTVGRTDRVKIPIIGGLLQLVGFSGMRGQKHIGYVYYGKSVNPTMKWSEKWETDGKHLYQAYNTDQEFQEGTRYETWTAGTLKERRAGKGRPIEVEIDGPYTYLSAWHIYGRYIGFYEKHSQKINTLIAILIFMIGMFLLAANITVNQKTDTPALSCKTPDSYIADGKQASINYKGFVYRAKVQNNIATVENTCFNLGK